MKKLLALLFALVVTAASANQDPIRLLIGYVPGSNSDKIARALQIELTAALHRPVVVEYKPGAGGDLAAAYVANDTSNSTVLLLSNINLPYYNITDNPNYNYKHLTPVAYLGYTPMILVGSSAFPYKSFSEWKTIPKDLPIKFGSSGIGSGTHLDGEVLLYTTNKNMLHVPYKGSGQMMPDLLAGRLDLAYSFVLSSKEFIESGKLTPLVVAADRRLESLPNVPTLNEVGLKNSWLKVWQILVANPTADPEVVKQVQQALTAMYNDPEKARVFSKSSDLLVDPAHVVLNKKFVEDEIKQYRQLASKIKTFKQ